MLRRILQFLLVGSFSTVIAACYGVIVDFQERFFRREIRTTDSDGMPIPELVVTLVDHDAGVVLASDTTDENGVAELEYLFSPARLQETLQVMVEDTDGENNGGEFETFDGDLGDDDPVLITMDPEI